MTVAQREEAAELVALARAMKALAHPARLRIVLGLRRAERCGCEFVRELGLDPSVVSRHLAQLRDAGLVAERRDGARVMYRLAWPCVLEAIRCMRQLIGRRASVGRRRSR
ncbi:MAG: metalloregulator ArsR/SmtB family transcription factor [Kiritimatiellae bacterium]|nr:metalloregulator ArsR/SmtB family transcription factor [Kiritimatiellia bacterium]